MDNDTYQNKNINIPLCDECGEPMVLRKNRNNGNLFWGCSTYPKCSNTKAHTDEQDREAPSDLKPVVLIPCGAKQRKGRWRAEELYESDTFKESLACAKALSDDVFILSTKHGLLDLNAEIDNYNVPTSKTPEESAAWGKKVTIQIVDQGINPLNTEFIIIAWKDFYGPLLKYLPYRTLPLRGVRATNKTETLKIFLRSRGVMTSYFAKKDREMNEYQDISESLTDEIEREHMENLMYEMDEESQGSRNGFSVNNWTDINDDCIIDHDILNDLVYSSDDDPDENWD